MADLDRALYHMKRSDEEMQTRMLAKQLKLPYVNLVGYPILANTLRLVTLDDIRKFGIVPFLRVNNTLRVAVTRTEPATLSFLQDLANRTGHELSIVFCSESSLVHAARLLELDLQRDSRAVSVSINQAAQAAAITAIVSPEELTQKLAKASATDVIELLFSAATGMDASDVHIEPQDEHVRVRFRIDGVLQEITSLSKEMYKQVVSRVKFLSHLKLDVAKTNQDGRFTITIGDTELDVRVSTLPSAYGEILDMRLLRSHAAFIKLDELGLSPNALAQIKEAVSLPHGMILVTGPTGSGKTTTLYAILDSLNHPGVKIITIEDPIEYRVRGIDQVGIDAAKGFNFAEALKGVLRQDPDIIMVGEIRDKETANIGLQAAMTGHLFLSTLHTNNAPAALARLIDMGIEPYKIAGAINLIIAQRLVRKLCTGCNGTGCTTCNKTGFKGRLPIIEVLKPSPKLDEAIMRQASIRELYDIAKQEGMVTMHEDGMQKVQNGLTTAEEVERVTRELQ